MKKSRLRAPIFLLGAHKSGTSLLRSLLDSHEELFVFPVECHFFQHLGYWVDYSLRRQMPFKHERQKILQSMIRYIKEYNSKEHVDIKYTDNPEFKGYNLDRFISSMKGEMPNTISDQFEFYIAALYYSIAGSNLPGGTRIVEKSVENAEFANLLRWMFPDSCFIHIVRDPYATIVSLRKAKTRKRYPYMGRIASSLYNSYYHLFNNAIMLDKYLVIKYEDLLINTEAIMRTVSEFLGITFSRSLLHPTYSGNPWKGNSTSNQAFNGISLTPVENWKREINDFEIHLVNKIANPVIENYDYEYLNASRSRNYPVKGESIKTFIKNRALFAML
jgi:hypothetical protein